ncbi:MAG: hypothetical protein ACYDCN_08205 [Bacteroidia bacterium]
MKKSNYHPSLISPKGRRMLIMFLLLLPFWKAGMGYAQNGVGKIFPIIKGETFTDKNITLPDVGKGKPCVIGMCFSKKAEEGLQSWLNPAYNEFVVKRDTTNAFGAAVSYDINFYFMPRFNIVNQVLEKVSKEKIKKGTDEAFWTHLFFCTEGVRDVKKSFDIEDTSQPYFFVLDKDGKIVHVEKGNYNDKKMSDLEDFLN